MNAAEKSPPFLEKKVQYLKGVGEKRADALRTIGIETVEDLLNFAPRRYLDRTNVKKISELVTGEEATVIAEVLLKRLERGRKSRLIVRVSDGSGTLEAIWFQQPAFFDRIFKRDQTVSFNGKVTLYRSLQMIHPDFDIISDQREVLNTGQVIPVYPSTQDLKRSGVSNYLLRRLLKQLLRDAQGKITENIPLKTVRRFRLLQRAAALQKLHYPATLQDVQLAIRRFKFEELFYLQLLIALRKHWQNGSNSALPVTIDQQRVRDFTASLPFQLTNAQKRTLNDIQDDLLSGNPLNRLVQGDVGSGKTVVALAAMVMVISSGYQCALMAPTEILAQQHFQNLQDLLRGSDLRCACLLGSLKVREKNRLQMEISEGKYDIVVGTHALIQENVSFPNLGLAIIDEQHRFGVMQRAELISKGRAPHVLVMTATPIPRTLALTIYGELDVSNIDEMPPGRKPVRTFWRTEERLPLIVQFLRQRLDRKEQVYVVYPLIEASEKLDLKDATRHFEKLSRELAPFTVELLHGRRSAAEKSEIMDRFKAGITQVLVATTVIEVGVDVASATVMMIENADRFGLSQLHQLRGRVGRGSQQAYCILVTSADISETAARRMQIMVDHHDGFLIAEEDLKIRGSGDFFGTRQHGMPELQFADLATDYKIVEAARETAFQLISGDVHLRKPENLEIRRHFQKHFSEKFYLPDIA